MVYARHLKCLDRKVVRVRLPLLAPEMHRRKTVFFFGVFGVLHWWNMSDDEQFRANVAVVVTDGHGRVLLCERIDEKYSGTLQTVQGGIDPGESVTEAAVREMGEELGIDPGDITVLGVMEEKFCYKWEDAYLAKFPFSKTIGQEQQFVLAMIDPGTVMKLDAHHQEFSRVWWGSPLELLEGSWERKKPGLMAALRFFDLLDVKSSVLMGDCDLRESVTHQWRS